MLNTKTLPVLDFMIQVKSKYYISIGVGKKCRKIPSSSHQFWNWSYKSNLLFKDATDIAYFMKAQKLYISKASPKFAYVKFI